MNSDPLFYYGHPSGQWDEPYTGLDQVPLDRFYPIGHEVHGAPPAVFHQVSPTGVFLSPTNSTILPNNYSMTVASSPYQPQYYHVKADPQPTHFFHQVSYAEPPLLSSHPTAELSEQTITTGYQDDVLFPHISTDLSEEKRRPGPAPVNIRDVYPTPDEPFFPHSTLTSEDHLQHRMSAYSQPTTPLESSHSGSYPPTPSFEQQQQQQQESSSIQEDTDEHIFQQPMSTTHSSMSFTSRLMGVNTFKITKSRAKSVPNLRGPHTTQPGPIPASRPMLKFDQGTGEEVLEFSYSKHKIITTFVIKCPSTRVDSKELPEEFLKENCVYPRAMVPVEEYKGNRGRYERECNEIGWTLAWSNPEIRNHRGLVQRAVDSWRNTRTDKMMRSRRVRKTEFKRL